MKSDNVLILVLFIALLTGCSGGGEGSSGDVSGGNVSLASLSSLVTLSATPENPTLAPGVIQQFTALGTFSDSVTRDLTFSSVWSSSDPEVATISSDGIVTAVTEGETTITALSGNVSVSTTLTVAARTLLSIDVNPADATLAMGTTSQFSVTGTYSDNMTQDLTALATWASSDPGIAAISNTGLATANDAGTTTITAAYGGIAGSTTLTVTSATLESIEVSPANPVIGQGIMEPFMAVGIYSDNTTQNLTVAASWSSTDESVATISNIVGANGRAFSVGAGTTTITATVAVTHPVPKSVTGSTALVVTGDAGASNASGEGGDGMNNVVAINVSGAACTNTLYRSYYNKPCVSVTVCTPGTSTCQTVNDILLDTGSSGLRIFKQALNVPLTQVTSGSRSLANCIQYGDGSSQWGPVKTAGVILGNEPAVQVPIHVIDSGFGARPSACQNAEQSPSDAGFNGILGVSFFAQDCGLACTISVNNRMYYSCHGSTCSGTTVPLANQIQNPVALLPVDNNGVIVQLPAIAAGGASSADGQLILGIGTRPNNAPSGVTAYPADRAGHITTVFNNNTYSGSFIDSGSNGLFIPTAPNLPVCELYTSWFCPSSTMTLTATNISAAGSPSGSVSFQIGNIVDLSRSHNNVFAEIGGPVPSGLDFDWGLPFFFGRNVYVGLEGKTSSLGNGLYWAY